MKEILQKLEDSNFSDANVTEIINDFFTYYSANDRHKYHEITIYIISKFEKVEDSETVSVILFNLKMVIDEVKKQCNCNHYESMYKCSKEQYPNFECADTDCDNKCLQYKILYRHLYKLFDHISLEQTRISDVKAGNSKLENLLEEVNQNSKILKESVRKATSKNTAFQNQIKKAEEKIDTMQKEYITILGIFASIVLAFTGGIAFSTSVLENIDAISPYRLTAVVIGLAFILINIIYILVWFVININYNNTDKSNTPLIVWLINVVLIVAFVITIVLSFKANNSTFEHVQDNNAMNTTQIEISLEAE